MKTSSRQSLLPDVSDLSIQIPHDSYQDQLLADTTQDFLGTNTDFFDTPKRPSSSHNYGKGRRREDLRLSEITPRHHVPAPPLDDMFERKKRDNYQVMGIDLTDKSTRGRGQAIEEAHPPVASIRDQSSSKSRTKKHSGLLTNNRITKKKRSTNPTLPPSEFSRTMETLAKLSNPSILQSAVGYMRERDALSGKDEPSNLRESTGLASKLALYGEKLLQAVASYALPVAVEIAMPALDSAKTCDPPLRLSELSPSKSASEVPVASTSQLQQDQPPMRCRPASPKKPPTKRTLASPVKERKKARRDDDIDMHSKGKGKDTTLIPTCNEVASIPTRRLPDLVGSPKKEAPLRPTVKPSQSKAPTKTTLTLMNPPQFPGDTFRQKALEKLAQQQEQREKAEKERREFKASAMPDFRQKPAFRQTRNLKPTIPVAFNFQSDLRAGKHKDEFEEKRKTWEKRTAVSAGVVPDFSSLHTSLAASTSSRARKAPLRPQKLPPLSTSLRAAERQKFEEAKKEKEKELEKLKEERRLAREIEVELALKEERKRTVPRANAVPDFYKGLSKKGLSLVSEE